MSILIISPIDDLHANAVKWGLSQFGSQATIWSWGNFPRSEMMSWSLNNDSAPIIQMNSNPDQNFSQFRTVWYRRAAKATPLPNSHPDDISVINRESNEFLRNICPFVGTENTLWINKPTLAHDAERKTVQLFTAKKVGFKIPDTLITNDISKVKVFFEFHQKKIVFKAFSPGRWENNDGSLTALRTSMITESHLKNEYAIKACPGIFQELIEKKYEIRVTVMGEVVLAALIDSQINGPTIDWRCDLGFELPVKVITLPEAISKQCLLLCKKLDLIFGCIDLILTPTGEYIFLEINEAGQFLWKERFAPEIPMLDSFCRLLAHDIPTHELAKLPKLSYADWKKSNSYEDWKKLISLSNSKH